MWEGLRRCCILLLLVGGARVQAGEATIAVAANFRQVALQIAEQLEAESGHRYRIVAGATGALYAQIRNGAPFDVFLAADLARPEWLFSEGLTTAEGVRTYATGKLAVWIPDGIGDFEANMLANPRYRRIAMANPQLAPYGAAAMTFLERADLAAVLRPRLVMAGNVSAAYSLVASGNAEAGLIAASTLREAQVDSREYVDLPAAAYEPIEQGAVLLIRAAKNPAARAWFDWLSSDKMLPLLSEAGYSLPGPNRTE